MLRGLCGHYADALTSTSYLSLFAFALHVNDKRIWLIAMGLVALISFFVWSSTFKRARTIADIATSRIASAAQGYVELYGRASVDAENLITSAHSESPVIVTRHRTRLGPAIGTVREMPLRPARRPAAPPTPPSIR